MRTLRGCEHSKRLYFGHDSLEAVIAALKAGAESDSFAADTLKGMLTRSPMSMAIACEQVKRGGAMDFKAVMVMEFRIVSRIVFDNDFYEGVRALIIDKDNKPVWNPATIEAIDKAAVAAHFAPLPADLTF